MATYGTYNTPGGFKLTVYGLIVIIGFLAMFYMARSMYHENRPQPINAARAAERKSTRLELTAKAEEALKTSGWVDQQKQIVRLPIARGMELVVQGYANPEAAHANLVERSKKASAPAPAAPAAPAQPSPFE